MERGQPWVHGPGDAAGLVEGQALRRGPSLLMARCDWFIVPEDQFEG
ncbi:hypothetical protein QFZ79_003144 [Arthrobacter sp. V4I6]|nr:MULTISPECIES: hypothetical protein [unclassified Arthrobacter]MDQ0820771.1 hypothetical protein [Arthrobacter sp. V1I7]MDQ0855033.1 hypothetical protein [Arthrobacter sp. V4I6]